MTRVLVLGPSGFLGRHLVARLKRRPGLSLTGLCRRPDSTAGVPTVACDLRDLPRLRRALRRLKPRWIFHLAGSPGGSDPEALLREHLSPTASLFEAAASLPPPRPRIVLAGSAAEYGRVSPGRLPVTEREPARPVTPYGAVKLAQTSMARALGRGGLDVVVARLFNVLGPGLQAHLSVSSFCRQIAEAERGLEPPVLETGSLAPRRDFVDVSDAVRALAALARGGRSGEVYNVCSGRSVSIRSVARFLIGLSRRPLRIQVRRSRVRAVDVQDIRGSFRKIRRELGWRPTVPLQSSLKAMLADARAQA